MSPTGKVTRGVAQLDVIAAALALPIVEAEMKRLADSRPTGENVYADKHRAEIEAQRAPLLARYHDLRATIFGQEASA